MENRIAGVWEGGLAQKFHIHFGHLTDQQGKRVQPEEIEKWFADKKLGEWQLCPKCNGDGNLLRFNSPQMLSTSTDALCDICSGSKLIQRPSQPIPVNQDESVLWEQAARVLYLKHNPDKSIDSVIGGIILNGFRKDMATLSESYSIQLKSSPSPTPVNEKEVQAEWEFLIIMRENYEAAKRGSEEDFAGTTKKEAVIEIYEDLIDIIKNLPLKRSGKEQEVIDYVNNLPQPSTPVQEGLREDEIKWTDDLVQKFAEMWRISSTRTSLKQFKEMVKENDGWVNVLPDAPPDDEKKEINQGN